MDLLNKHVTIRRFTDQTLPDELLNSIIYSGTRASTTGNMQLYSIIIHHEGEIKRSLIPLHFNQSVASGAPVLLTFIADLNRFSAWCKIRDAEPGYNNFLWFLNAVTDALLVAQNICVAAENAGLGICYLGTTLYNAQEIIQLLELPELTFPVTALAIGWPDEKPELTDRLPLEGIIHFEKYKTCDSQVLNEIYALKENLSINKKFIAENNKETLSQVFTDLRYKTADNIHFSGKLIKALKIQGFL